MPVLSIFLMLIITEPAAELIRAHVNASSIQNPVVYLLVGTDVEPLPPDIARAQLRGDTERVRAWAVQQSQDALASGKVHLQPTVFSRERYPENFLVRIGEFTFVIPPWIRPGMQGWSVELDGRELRYRDSAGRLVPLDELR